MSVVYGFELMRERHIPELNAWARLYRHQRTGAELLSIENNDENKVFGVTFKTPPTDSTGLPHIMEHSVLGGSRKYPVKEPFVELLKGSLSTFVNAMTFSDMTTYPVASQNLQDFYNLIDVYLDAVFYPTITPDTLKQEGWHYEIDPENGQLAYRGIVFNEMKGAYSSPDGLLGRYSEQYLLPDTPYAYDSGGDPAVIPSLTYEQFKAFHDTYYHPANARFFFAGDDDPMTRLRLINDFIADYSALEVHADVPLQPRWTAPRRVTRPYAASDDSNNKAFFTISWLLPEVTDTDAVTDLQLLSHILMDTPASPLRKALIESGLGEDVTGGGLSIYQRQMTFSAGMKGIAKENIEKAEALILQTLGELAEKGIEPDMVAAALNTTEFQLRELNTGSFPRGLALMIGILPVWLHGGDPLEALAFEEPLNRLRARIANGGYLEKLIGDYFVNNPHRSTVILEPDAHYNHRLEIEETQRLAAIRATMDQDDIQRIAAEAEALQRRQETPDSPEALATIPMLRLSDLERNIRLFPIEVTEESGSKVLYHDLFTNGIAYLDIGFDLRVLPQHLLPYVRLFAQALTEMGTQKEDYARLAQRIGIYTGGISASPFTTTVLEDRATSAWLMIRGKAMYDRTDKLLDILRDIFLMLELDNRERFRQIVLEAKVSLESALVPSGHNFANTRLRSHFSEMYWLNEQMSGISYLFFLRELAGRIETGWESVLADLRVLQQKLINRRAMLANVTLDAANWGKFAPQLRQFIADLPDAPVALATWMRDEPSRNEGLTIPAQVNYVAKGGPLYELGYQLHGSHVVITNYLRLTYLWERVRAQGGAYGVNGNFDFTTGIFSYTSYRDPNLLKTLDNFDGAAAFLQQLELSDSELTKSIIGAIGDMDAHLLPDAKGFTSMIHHLIGYSNEQRQRVRDQVLSTTLADYRAFGDVLAQLNRSADVVVMGSADAIEKANAERGHWLKVQKVL